MKQSWIFSVTWSFRNHSNMLIYNQCLKNVCCLIFFGTCDIFCDTCDIFQDSLRNKKLKRTVFIQNIHFVLLSHICSMNFCSLTTRYLVITWWRYLAHHIDSCITHYCCTSPIVLTTIPIIHCTDDTHSWFHWLHSWSHNHTHFISLGLPLCHRQVLFCI